jgi:hypothetical protein
MHLFYYHLINYKMIFKIVKFYEYISIIKLNKINNLNSKYKYQILKYKLKNKLITSNVTKTKINDISSLKEKNSFLKVISDF